MAIYEVVSGYFIQDDLDPSTLPAIPPRFGLRDESDDRWRTLHADLVNLNSNAEPGTSYKLFFLGRHGQGFHNLAEQKYGSKAWDDYWSKLNTDGEIRWGPDAELTPLGIAQANDARSAWKKELAFDAPLPDKMYCSPLTRASRTHQITFQDVIPSRKTLVVEFCREENGVHTCDKRRSRTYIHQTFPLFEIEEGFTEDDELWSPDTREIFDQVMHRAKCVLDAIFNEDHYVVAITAHGGFIRAFMRVLNRVTGTIPTGGVLPVLVKATRIALN
ncbi:histidine phosphatase superfamily [Amanita rubescens]|nr:histidine phosphatase superfamily [Amanita rubescens]